MEFEDLKNIWKKQDPSIRHKGEAEIASMLRGTSNSIILKLKRSVWIELLFTSIAGIGLLVYALTLPAGGLKWISIAILVVFVGYTFYYIKKLQVLNKFDTADGNIRNNLENLVTKLRGYLKYYRMSYTILYPVYFVLGVMFGSFDQGMDRFIEMITTTRTLVYLGLLALTFYFCTTWLVQWLLKKMYSNHIAKLEKLLEDINEKF